MKVVDHLVNSIRSSANYNTEAESRPHCILWTDKDRLWETTIGQLKEEMPELLQLGDYDPEKLQGPAIWLRVAVAGLVKIYSVPYGKVPVIYLPGISRHDIRAIDQCPDELKPLAELQYRGVIWSQINSKDWTPFAYLKTKKGGLGLNVAQDEQTLYALKRALKRILYENIENLTDEYLDKDYFNSITIGGDQVRDILNWMTDPDTFRRDHIEEEWQAFADICKTKYKVDPEKDGVLGAAEKLAWKDEAWNLIWDRFYEAPEKYPGIPKALKGVVMPIGVGIDRWPEWNEQQETLLRTELKALEGLTDQNARSKLIELEKEHGSRRDYVWAKISESNLAIALKWLSLLAELTDHKVNGNFEGICQAFGDWGWKADDAVIKALLCVNKKDDTEAVISSIRSVYLPWIDENSRLMQKLFRENEHPDKNQEPKFNDNECVYFVDGLRFDIAKHISEELITRGYKVLETIKWAKIPTVTATCKPAIGPIYDHLLGDDSINEDFEPILKETGQRLTTQKMDSLLTHAGWKVLKKGDIKKESELFGWIEYGHIDEDGHIQGWKIVNNVSRYIQEIIDEIEDLLSEGWKSIRLITDHGWIMIPKGFPKAVLPASLSDNKWGRCAAIKSGALFSGSLYPWYWNESVNFALPEGASCYREGLEYAHGGISPQECILLNLVISDHNSESKKEKLKITDIAWKGMRCKVALDSQYEGLKLDIRTQLAVADSSIVMNIKVFDTNGIASVVVDDDANEGATAYLVILDNSEKPVYQTTVIVGGEQ